MLARSPPWRTCQPAPPEYDEAEGGRYSPPRGGQPAALALLPIGGEWYAVVMPYDRMLAVAEDMGPLAMEHCPILGDLT